MARRIVEGGHELTLCAAGPPRSNRTPTPRRAGRVAPNWQRRAIWSACASSATDDVKHVLEGDTVVLAGLAPGGIVAIHSTVHPDTCREIAKQAADKGISVIDAPVSGGRRSIRWCAARHGRRRRGRRRKGPSRIRDLF